MYRDHILIFTTIACRDHIPLFPTKVESLGFRRLRAYLAGLIPHDLLITWLTFEALCKYQYTTRENV